MRLAIAALLSLASTVASAQAWTLHELARPYRGADGLDAYDVDGDGHLDLACAWEAGGALTVTRGGSLSSTWPAPTFTVDYAGGRGYEDVRVDDWDGDGLPDYVGAAEGSARYPGVYAFMSHDGYDLSRATGTGEEHYITVTSWDVSGHGGADLVAGGLGRIVWWRARPDRGAGAWSRRVISGSAHRPLWIAPADLDGDGDLDALWTDRVLGGLWSADNPGDPVPTAPWVTTQLVGGVGALIACEHDMDGDGDPDVILPLEDGRVVWAERTHAVSTWATHDIPVPWDVGQATLAKGCAVGDVVGSSEPDLVVTLWQPDALYPPELLPHRVWVADALTTWSPIDPAGAVLKTDEPLLVDLDGDGDLDVALSDEGMTNSSWGPGVVALENPR